MTLQVAVKVLKKTRGSQARAKVLRKLAREIDLLAKLQDCCNVVQLLTVYEDDQHAYLVCEFCRGGDLERVLMVRPANNWTHKAPLPKSFLRDTFTPLHCYHGTVNLTVYFCSWCRRGVHSQNEQQPG